MEYKNIRLKDLYPLTDERGYKRENDEFHWQFIHETLLRLKELENEVVSLKSRL